MRVLHLNLKKKWFDMILSGEKKEEYREIKPYWISRLMWTLTEYLDNEGQVDTSLFQTFDSIIFSNGYAKDRPQFEIEFNRIRKGIGNPEWGAIKGEKYFVLELGKIISTTNLNKDKP